MVRVLSLSEYPYKLSQKGLSPHEIPFLANSPPYFRELEGGLIPCFLKARNPVVCEESQWAQNSIFPNSLINLYNLRYIRILCKNQSYFQQWNLNYSINFPNSSIGPQLGFWNFSLRLQFQIFPDSQRDFGIFEYCSQRVSVLCQFKCLEILFPLSESKNYKIFLLLRRPPDYTIVPGTNPTWSLKPYFSQILPDM